MIRPEGAGSGRVTTRGELGRPGWSRRHAAVAGLVVAALVAAATVAIVLSARSGSGGGPSSIPAPPTASTPARQAAQTPPYGFTANWADYCYRALAAPPHYAVDPVAVSEPCRAGWTRLTTAQQMGLSARAGATVDRLAVSWGKVEPTPPLQQAGSRVHRFNWASVATVYRAMLSAGMRPIVLVYGTPPWARQLGWDRPGTCRAAHNEGCSYPPSPRHLVDWRTFIGALVRRFPRMVALEVWNEPNVPRFWAPLPSPTLYSRLLQAADKAAHGSGVPVPVVTGGLASQQTGAHGGIPAATFLTRVYRLVGLASFDGIGVHPYPQGPPWTQRMTADLDVLRRVRDRFHDHANAALDNRGGRWRNLGIPLQGERWPGRSGTRARADVSRDSEHRRQGLHDLRPAGGNDAGPQVRALRRYPRESPAEAGLLLRRPAPRQGPSLPEPRLMCATGCRCARMCVGYPAAARNLPRA